MTLYALGVVGPRWWSMKAFSFPTSFEVCGRFFSHHEDVHIRRKAVVHLLPPVWDVKAAPAFVQIEHVGLIHSTYQHICRSYTNGGRSTTTRLPQNCGHRLAYLRFTIDKYAPSEDNGPRGGRANARWDRPGDGLRLLQALQLMKKSHRMSPPLA